MTAMAPLGPENLVSLSPGVRLQREAAQDRDVLLYPEGMVQLNEIARDILAAVAGDSIEALVGRLAGEYDGIEDADVMHFLMEARTRGWVRIDS